MELVKGGSVPKDSLGERLIVLAHGAPGSGKTSFALSFPSPIFFVNLDREASHLLQKLPEHYEIYYERILYDVDLTSAKATQILKQVSSALQQALAFNSTKGPCSFVIDGYDILWDIVKISLLPQGGEALAREYGDCNAWMHSLGWRLHNSGMNVCLTALSKEVWTGQTRGTGLYDPEGFRHRGRSITHQVYLFSPEDTTPPLKPTSGAPSGQTHRGYIQISKINEELVRTVVPNLDFLKLYKLVFGKNPDNASLLWTPSGSTPVS